MSRPALHPAMLVPGVSLLARFGGWGRFRPMRVVEVNDGWPSGYLESDVGCGDLPVDECGDGVDPPEFNMDDAVTRLVVAWWHIGGGSL